MPSSLPGGGLQQVFTRTRTLPGGGLQQVFTPKPPDPTPGPSGPVETKPAGNPATGGSNARPTGDFTASVTFVAEAAAEAPVQGEPWPAVVVSTGTPLVVHLVGDTEGRTLKVPDETSASPAAGERVLVDFRPDGQIAVVSVVTV